MSLWWKKGFWRAQCTVLDDSLITESTTSLDQIACLACSRLSVSGDDRKSGRGTSGIWMEKAREGEPVSIVLETYSAHFWKDNPSRMSNVKMLASSRSSYLHVYHRLHSMFWYSCSRFTCHLCWLKSQCKFCQNLQYLNYTSVADTTRVKRISRNFTGSKKNIKFVYQSRDSISTFASFKWHQQATCKMNGID